MAVVDDNGLVNDQSQLSIGERYRMYMEVIGGVVCHSIAVQDLNGNKISGIYPFELFRVINGSEKAKGVLKSVLSTGIKMYVDDE